MALPYWRGLLGGCSTFSDFCSERLHLTRRQREALILWAELVEVIPAFDTNKLLVDIPEGIEQEDFVRAWEILNEIEALSAPPRS